MKIELRNLETSMPTEGELVEYQAEVWIDGALAFEASSDGDFGQDVFIQVGSITRDEVDQWIGENRPGTSIDGIIYPADLGSEIADMVDTAAFSKIIEHTLKTKLVTIQDNQVVTYDLVGPRDLTIAALEREVPSALIVTANDNALIVRAARLLFKEPTNVGVN
jgi:hypothetical protein